MAPGERRSPWGCEARGLLSWQSTMYVVCTATPAWASPRAKPEGVSLLSRAGGAEPPLTEDPATSTPCCWLVWPSSFCTVIGVGVITFVGCLSVVAFSLSLGLDFASEPRRLEDEQRQQTAAL